MSVKGLTYQRIYDYCQQQDPPMSMSGFVEEVAHKYLDEKRVPVPELVTTTKRKKKKTHEDDPPWGNHFTF